MEHVMKLRRCIICDSALGGENNPEPVRRYEEGRCCDWCNTHIVVPARIGRLGMGLPMRNTEEDE